MKGRGGGNTEYCLLLFCSLYQFTIADFILIKCSFMLGNLLRGIVNWSGAALSIGEVRPN